MQVGNNWLLMMTNYSTKREASAHVCSNFTAVLTASKSDVKAKCTHLPTFQKQGMLGLTLKASFRSEA